MGPFFDVSFLFCLVIIVYYFMAGKFFVVDIISLNLILVCGLIFVLALFNLIFLDFENIINAIRGISRPIKAIIIVLAVSIYIKNIFRNEEIFLKIHKILYLVIVFHAAIMVAQFVFPAFRDFIYQYTTANEVLEIYKNTRMAGLTGGGGAQISIVQSIGLLVSVFLFFEHKRSICKFVNILFALLILLSIFLSGRSGFLTAMLICPIYFAYLLYESHSAKEFVSGFSSVVLLASLLLISWVFVLPILGDGEYTDWIVNRSFQTFFTYANTGEFQDNTLDAMLEMLIFPDDPWHLLLGRVSYLDTNTLYGINTDLGYLRILWGYGLIGSAFHYIFYLIMLAAIFKLRYVSRVEKSLSVFIVILILFFHLKEILIFSKMSFQITLIAFFSVFYLSRFRRLALDHA